MSVFLKIFENSLSQSLPPRIPDGDSQGKGLIQAHSSQQPGCSYDPGPEHVCSFVDRAAAWGCWEEVWNQMHPGSNPRSLWGIVLVS